MNKILFYFAGSRKELFRELEYQLRKRWLLKTIRIADVLEQPQLFEKWQKILNKERNCA